MKLNEFCKINLTCEKIFIVPTKSIGMQIVNKMARDGNPAINLKIATLKGLAFEICEEYIEKNRIMIVDSIIGSNLMIGILKKLSKEEDEFFFKQSLIDSTTAEEVYKAIMELKYAGIEEFPKIKNLDMIYKAYGEELKDLNAMDHCDVIIKASLLEDLNTYKNNQIVVASNIELNYAEESLFEKLTDNNFVKIDMPVKTLEGHPRNYYFKDFVDEGILKNKNFCFYNKYGTKEEIGYIIEDMKQKLIPADEIVIAYTNNNYADLINIEFEKNNLPITFGDGLGIDNSSVYRFISTIFNWVNRYYSVTELRPIFVNGDIKTNFPASDLYDELMSLKIVYDRDNYFRKLYLDGVFPLEFNNYSEYRKMELIYLQEFFGDIFDAIPNENSFDFSKYIFKLSNIIEKYVKNINKYDGAAKNVVLETLNQISNIKMEVNVNEYMDMISSYILKNRILRSQPQPGMVFATNFRNAGYTGRKHLYLIEMDSDSISNKVIESPILLDMFKKRLSGNLKYARENYNSKKYKIKELLTADFESISIGYSNFDTVEVKGKSPSQVYTELMDTYKTNREKPIYEEKYTILGRDLVKSGSALETISGCVRKAYFAYKMGIKAIEPKETLIEYWLDPLERGSLVHEILNRYFNLERGDRTDKVLNEILEDACTRARENKASILDDVYLKEKVKLLEICNGMIETSHIDDEWEVLVNELSFGMDKDNKTFGILPCVKINILDLELPVIGAIDRVDLNRNTKELRIIDYKTGNKSNFEKLLRLKTKKQIIDENGKTKEIDEFDYSKTRKMQYYIYKKVLERIIEIHPIYRDYKISSFSYIFEDSSIDIRFDGDFIKVIENRISDLLNIDVLAEQKNAVYDPDDRDTCMYCDYSPICMVDTDENHEEVKIG